MDQSPVRLTPIPIRLDSPEFSALLGWPFQDEFVARLLHNDIPQRVQFGNCRIWIYRDPQGRLAGFGTLDKSRDCQQYTDGRLHTYIPLLATNPTIQSLGYGTSIVRHLIAEAAILVCGHVRCHDTLFLDVYSTSEKAINLYTKNGFSQISPPMRDDQDEEKLYIVMSQRVSIAGS